MYKIKFLTRSFLFFNILRNICIGFFSGFFSQKIDTIMWPNLWLQPQDRTLSLI